MDCEKFQNLMLWKFHNGGFGTSKVLASCHLWVQKVQTFFFAYGRVWVSPPPHGIPNNEAAFIKWQSTIHWFLPPPKTVGQNAKSNHKVDPNVPPITNSTDRTFMWHFLERLTSVSLSPNQIGDAISLAITCKAPFSAASRELAKVALEFCNSCQQKA